jgi:hypothetical protein
VGAAGALSGLYPVSASNRALANWRKLPFFSRTMNKAAACSRASMNFMPASVPSPSYRAHFKSFDFRLMIVDF